MLGPIIGGTSKDAEDFLKASGKQGAYLFKLNGPSLFDTAPDGYVTLKDKNGALRLAQEWVGTSFASPHSAASAGAAFLVAKERQ